MLPTTVSDAPKTCEFVVAPTLIASGAVAGDSSAFGNTGTVSGAVRAAGKFGNAMSFDGVNDSVTVADAGSINLASGMTIEAWVKPTAIDRNRPVCPIHNPIGMAIAPAIAIVSPVR